MSLYSKLSYISRTKKLALFDRLFSATKQMRVLDIGAEINPNGNLGLKFARIVRYYHLLNKYTAFN